MNNKKNNIAKMVVLAILIALTIVLQAFATTFKVGQFSLPLALVAIAVGAIMYGPLGGLLLGTIWGLYIFIFDPSCATFMNYNGAQGIIGTILAVIVRGALDGLFTGLVYKGLNKLFKFKSGNWLAMFISAMLLPLFNSFVFTLCEFIIFRGLLESLGVSNVWAGFFTLNLGISCLVSFILAPVVSRICQAGFSILNLKSDKNDVVVETSEESSKNTTETKDVYNLD